MEVLPDIAKQHVGKLTNSDQNICVSISSMILTTISLKHTNSIFHKRNQVALYTEEHTTLQNVNKYDNYMFALNCGIP